MNTIMELVEELVRAERDLAYATSSFDRIGKRDRQKDVYEARAALTAELAQACAALEMVHNLIRPPRSFSPAR